MFCSVLICFGEQLKRESELGEGDGGERAIGENVEGVGEDVVGGVGVDGQGSHQYGGQHSSSNMLSTFAVGRNFKLVKRYLIGLTIYTPRHSLSPLKNFSLFFSHHNKSSI